jgi:hypothetical protein
MRASERGSISELSRGLVHSRRDGDAGATFRRIPNLAQVRIVVS